MKNYITLISVVLTCCLINISCSTLVISKAVADKEPNGIRVYPPKIYLIIYEKQELLKTSTDKIVTQKFIKIMTLPDMTKGYDIKPVSFLARNNFEISLSDGQLTNLKADLDTTAIINLLKSMVEKGAEVAKTSLVSEIEIEGSIKWESGMYEFDTKNGLFKFIQSPQPSLQ
ncbi:MAG: hypothetical protein L6277_02050 [Desulfobacterales bacterium]|nr:hypothetical protein [Pseudomonadota bacterium]MBU4354256.1 hypothetical protein [Pseudomonadota bacterium]MCG2770857.1 hypothetical protein [Desulfobacterales bacterium]